MISPSPDLLIKGTTRYRLPYRTLCAWPSHSSRLTDVPAPYNFHYDPLAPARDRLDKINFQRLVILCLLRLRAQDPDVQQDQRTFLFLREPYWEIPWRSMNDPIRAAAEELERDSWGGVRRFIRRALTSACRATLVEAIMASRIQWEIVGR